MSKKKKKLTQLEIWKGIRKLWFMPPVTKVKPNTKKKNRAQIKQAFRREHDEI